jgi:acetate kinase
MPLVGVLNAGSSSLKFALFDGEERRFSGSVDGIGGDKLRAAAIDARGTPVRAPEVSPAKVRSVADAIHVVLPWFNEHRAGRQLDGVGHRLVHGGPAHERPVRVTPALLADLDRLVPLAPLHEPAGIAAIRAVAAEDPATAQVVCFDTAFHRTNPTVAQAFAIPEHFFDDGVRRYGFHGLSYEYIASALPEIAPPIADGRVVVAHLGNGASLCALAGGVSQASTMGFSTLDGIPMGTRPGALDAGVILHLLGARGMSLDDVQDLLYRRSGMLGLSGISADFRDLEASTDPAAAFALDVFAYRVAGAVATLAAALGGIDGLVFTAGVGEHAAGVRAAIARRCAWLGLRIDPVANAAHATHISAADSAVRALVIPTDEERMIARHTCAVLAAAASSPR